MQSPGEAPAAARPRIGDVRLRARVQELEAELSDMDACADELEAELDALHSDGQALHSRVVQLEVRQTPSGCTWTWHGASNTLFQLSWAEPNTIQGNGQALHGHVMTIMVNCKTVVLLCCVVRDPHAWHVLV